MEPHNFSQKRKASLSSNFMPAPYLGVSPQRHGSVPPTNQNNEGESMA